MTLDKIRSVVMEKQARRLQAYAGRLSDIVLKLIHTPVPLGVNHRLRIKR